MKNQNKKTEYFTELDQYQVIYADPPWHYNNRKTGGERNDKTKFGGGAMKHYPLMPDADLLAMRPFIDSLADKNCALFMWATMPRLDFAIELLKGWGFRYATNAFTWVKHKKKLSVSEVLGDQMLDHNWVYGPGYYTASNVEVVLLGIKGSMPPVRKMTPSIITTERFEHSRKPILHCEIDHMYPEAKKIELFARNDIGLPSWDVWGNHFDDEVQK